MAQIVLRFRKGKQNALNKIRENLRNPKKRLLPAIGVMTTAFTKQHFRDQGDPSGSWPERMTPNVPGIIKDISAGRKVKARRWSPRPALRDEGNLSKSIQWVIKSRNSVVVLSPLDYAPVHQHGGESETEVITKSAQMNLWNQMKGAGRERRDKLDEVAWLLNKKFRGQTLTINVAPRPYLTLNKQEIKKISSRIAVRILNKR